MDNILGIRFERITPGMIAVTPTLPIPVSDLASVIRDSSKGDSLVTGTMTFYLWNGRILPGGRFIWTGLDHYVEHDPVILTAAFGGIASSHVVIPKLGSVKCSTLSTWANNHHAVHGGNASGCTILPSHIGLYSLVAIVAGRVAGFRSDQPVDCVFSNLPRIEG
jgi:hypothetical protein